MMTELTTIEVSETYRGQTFIVVSRVGRNSKAKIAAGYPRDMLVRGWSGVFATVLGEQDFICFQSNDRVELTEVWSTEECAASIRAAIDKAIVEERVLANP